ncbi:SAYSvFN domain-containing protein 1 [Aphis craccivora]|uniref:SAYSvFN domain-containing protein 1 n=1 Tax=Aphis craccivora TaxID=307492 RepID=A0A6G0ZK92_APHCR|nr:SAYSvFN domain-containing protein 1 [Aphis craccivora]
METETIVMNSRRRMVLKPLSPGATLQCKEQKLSSNDTNEHVPIQTPATLISPKNDKKKILFQDTILPDIVPTVQRNKVLLTCTINKDLTDSDDSDSEDSTVNNVPVNKSPTSNTKLYYIIMFLCWAAVQYWMIAVVGFGAVFFAVSALVAIYYNTSNSKKKPNALSAYSVFNPQCTPIQGSVDPKQLERELLFG